MNAQERNQLDQMLDQYLADRNRNISLSLLKAETAEIERMKREIALKGTTKGTKVC